MARKQAHRRKRTQTLKIKLPKIRLARVLTPFVAVLMVAATYRLSTGLLDRNIDSIEVVRRGRVRRAKLYYLRSRRGKSARIAEVTNYKPKAAKAGADA